MSTGYWPTGPEYKISRPQQLNRRVTKGRSASAAAATSRRSQVADEFDSANTFDLATHDYE